VSHFAMNHAIHVAGQRRAVPAEVEMPGPEGDRVREAVGRRAYELNVQQYCCAGLNFGYFYDRSPIIAYDGETPPAYTMADYTPSTVPGARLPHLWLADGRSLYDALGSDYTLLRCDPALDATPLLVAAAAERVPLTLLDVASPEAPALYREKLVLARPDQHVAWRGDALPRDPAALIARISGRAAGPAM
jgi:hypothetical protein